MARRRRRSIAIDFDGVIHRYSKGWNGGAIYDPPVDGARDALARIHRRYNVIIFTTRVNPEMHGGDAQMEAVVAWLEENGFRRGEHFDEITHVKQPALVYIDDRALRFTAWDTALQELDELYPLGCHQTDGITWSRTLCA